MNRFSVAFAGESGHGINLSGELTQKAIKNYGIRTLGYREYPSLIKGGIAVSIVEFTINNKEVRSISNKFDIVVFTSRKSLKANLSRIKKGGIFIHSQLYLNYSREEVELIKRNKLYEVFIDIEKILDEIEAPKIEGNMVYLGMVARLLGLPLRYLEELIKKQFAKKPDDVKSNLLCLKTGYDNSLIQELNETPILQQIKEDHSVEKGKIITGNDLIGLGAIACGVRMFVGYPMTPSTTIMKFLSSTYHQSGIIIKQAEDEITAAQMAIGGMYMGTRALTATSGGGFDLMTESLSLSGITEVPFVCVIAQRPGPATGLPTWTSDSDLNLALYSGHGEFTRCVLSVSDMESCYIQIQRAFNIAEKFQIPVLLLTDKYLAESNFLLHELPNGTPIERGLIDNLQDLENLSSKKRYEITNDGLSKRWLPTKSKATYVTNSDEHLEDGSVSEGSEESRLMYEKRIQKERLVLDYLNDPVFYGDRDADISFIGWGSAKTAILDLLDDRDYLKKKNLKVNYLHFDDIFPLRTERLRSFVEKSRKVVFVENNYLGQFMNLVKQQTGLGFEDGKNYLLNKYNGRPFYVSDIKKFLKERNL